jgi:hypothetical protein
VSPRAPWTQCLGLPLLVALAGCVARPPLPPLTAAWRETPVSPHRVSAPPSLAWSPTGASSAVHALRLRNGLTVHQLQRARASAQVLLVSPSAGLQSRVFHRATLASARAALMSALAAESDGLGLYVDATTSDLGTVVSAVGPRGALRQVATRFSAALGPAGVPDVVITRARDRLSLRRRDDVGLGEAMEVAILQQLYGEESAAARPPMGYSSELRAVTVEDVRRALLGAFATQRASLVVVSDASPEEAQPILEETLGALELAPEAPSERASETVPAEMQPVILVPAGGLLSGVTVACPLGSSRGGDFAAQRAFAAVLGASMGSQLDELIRGEHALVYDAVDAEVRGVGGQATLLLTLRPAQADAVDVVELVMQRLDEMATRGFGQTDAERAVSLLQEQRELDWDSPDEVGHLVASELLAGAAPQPPNRGRMRELTAEHLLEIASRCPARRLTVAVSGVQDTLTRVARSIGRPDPQVRYWLTPRE